MLVWDVNRLWYLAGAWQPEARTHFLVFCVLSFFLSVSPSLLPFPFFCFFHCSPCTLLISPPTQFLFHNLIFHVPYPSLVSILYLEDACDFREEKRRHMKTTSHSDCASLGCLSTSADDNENTSWRARWDSGRVITWLLHPFITCSAAPSSISTYKQMTHATLTWAESSIASFLKLTFFLT